MGSPIWGTDNFFDQFLSSRLSKVVSAQDSIAILEPQVELHLLCNCLGSCKIIHLLCIVLFCILQSFLEEFYCHLKGCLSRILQCSLPNDSWCQFSLPFRLGDLGFRLSCSSTAAAFLGSCNSVRVLTSQLLSQDFHDLVFPGEAQAATIFDGFSSDIFIPTATQQDLQALLDQTQYDKLSSSLNIRQQARLQALSHSSGASSGWLKAIPQVSLALAIPGPKFVVALCLWLGIPLFSLSPLCVCLTLPMINLMITFLSVP